MCAIRRTSTTSRRTRHRRPAMPACSRAPRYAPAPRAVCTSKSALHKANRAFHTDPSSLVVLQHNIRTEGGFCWRPAYIPSFVSIVPSTPIHRTVPWPWHLIKPVLATFAALGACCVRDEPLAVRGERQRLSGPVARQRQRRRRAQHVHRGQRVAAAGSAAAVAAAEQAGRRRRQPGAVCRRLISGGLYDVRLRDNRTLLGARLARVCYERLLAS